MRNGWSGTASHWRTLRAAFDPGTRQLATREEAVETVTFETRTADGADDEHRREEKWDFRRIRHTCEHVRTLNPLARGCIILPDENFLFRQRCAQVRRPHTGPATLLLTATLVHQPEHYVRGPTTSSPSGAHRGADGVPCARTRRLSHSARTPPQNRGAKGESQLDILLQS